MSNYRPTIGLEIHAELNTRTKMFCDSLNDPDEKHPNINVCPVCLGHPGTLPTINKKAVEHVIKVGLALGGKINSVTKFDRKNYFYPDLPKGYQISQYDQPIVEGGTLNGVRIRRVHLEEDTGTLVHERGGPSAGSGRPATLVDFNRAGVPLMELVTEPDLKSVDEVVAFAKDLQMILRYLGVSNADMEKGQMRIEANISLGDMRPRAASLRGEHATPSRFATGQASDKELGTKVELKNINSFKFAKDAIEYEIKRQSEVLEKGEKIKQETRGWDSVNKKTFSQRSKEEAHDYRYFPEPDLPPFETSVFDLEKLKIELPELPQEKTARFMQEYGFNPAKIAVIIEDPECAEFVEEYISELKSFMPEEQPTAGVDIVINDLRGLMAEAGIGFANLKIEPEHIAHLEALIKNGTIGSRQAKDVLRKMFDTGVDPEEIVKTEGLETVSDSSELEKVVKKVIEENSGAVSDYKKGKEQALQFLVGKSMAALRGKGEPNIILEIIKNLLK